MVFFDTRTACSVLCFTSANTCVYIALMITVFLLCYQLSLHIAFRWLNALIAELDSMYHRRSQGSDTRSCATESLGGLGLVQHDDMHDHESIV